MNHWGRGSDHSLEFPAADGGLEIAPTLVTGNLKLAEQTPVSILVLMEIIGDLLPPGAVLAFFNQGEVCTCPSRLLVQESIYPQFMQMVIDRAAQIKRGNPLDADQKPTGQLRHQPHGFLLGIASRPLGLELTDSARVRIWLLAAVQRSRPVVSAMAATMSPSLTSCVMLLCSASAAC